MIGHSDTITIIHGYYDARSRNISQPDRRMGIIFHLDIRTRLTGQSIIPEPEYFVTQITRSDE